MTCVRVHGWMLGVRLAWQAGDDVSDSEDEDFAAKLSDAFVLVGNTEEDASIMELHVYDEEQGSLFGATAPGLSHGC